MSFAILIILFSEVSLEVSCIVSTVSAIYLGSLRVPKPSLSHFCLTVFTHFLVISQIKKYSTICPVTYINTISIVWLHL